MNQPCHLTHQLNYWNWRSTLQVALNYKSFPLRGVCVVCVCVGGGGGVFLLLRVCPKLVPGHTCGSNQYFKYMYYYHYRLLMKNALNAYNWQTKHKFNKVEQHHITIDQAMPCLNSDRTGAFSGILILPHYKPPGTAQQVGIDQSPTPPIDVCI